MLPIVVCLYGLDRVEVVVEDLRQPAERLVVDAQAPLFLDHLALVLERRLVDAQRRHAIGFHPQHQRQILRRHRLPEHRRVVVRVGVALPADARQHRRVLFGIDVLRALEHHVLEQMGEPGPSRLSRPSSRRDTRPRRARSGSNGRATARPSGRWGASPARTPDGADGRRRRRASQRHAGRQNAADGEKSRSVMFDSDLSVDSSSALRLENSLFEIRQSSSAARAACGR